MYEQKHN